MCIFVFPPFLSHSSASVKYLSLQHIQVWFLPASFISLHLPCPAITDCLCTTFSLPTWAVPLQSLHHSYLRSSLLLAKQHWRNDQEQRKSSFPTSAPSCPLPHPIPLLQFLEESSCYSNFGLFPFSGLGYSQAYLCTGYLWDLSTGHKSLLCICKLKFPEVAT